MTDASIASGLKAATNLGIGEALLSDPTYGAELKKVFDLYKTNKVAAADLLFKTKWAKLDTDVRDRYLLKLENSDFTQKIRNYAKTAMPDYVKKLIDQGQDLTDIINPYRATISDVLDIPYNSIDVTDKNIQNALAGNISLADLRKQLRKDDRWQYTDAARSEVASVTRQVLQDFGFMG